jgi:hypothetical protein
MASQHSIKQQEWLLMRLALAVLLIASALVGGCSRAQTYVAEPRLAPRMYGQGQHLNGQRPDNQQPNTEAPYPSSGGYAIPNPSSEPASRENPLGPVPRTDSKPRYPIQEARA